MKLGHLLSTDYNRINAFECGYSETKDMLEGTNNKKSITYKN